MPRSRIMTERYMYIQRIKQTSINLKSNPIKNFSLPKKGQIRYTTGIV
jgi:hypothetical protein